ncbi:MAG: hypothetical protein NC085_08565, partial [Muribaculaceae bacterium]|nr:hypothetical protein [Muribaculaceae bacterium]MCM1479745.1 hypothetical protein [Muribaculaceae bacterium]
NNAETVTETETSAKISETTTTAETTESTIITTEETTTVTEREYMQGEERLLGFLSYLQHKGFADSEHYFYFDGADFSQYGFMDDFTLDGYSYTHRENGGYDVTLTCSDSTCEMFPNGNSYWVFGDGFFPAERESRIIAPHDIYNMENITEQLKTAFYAAVDFSLCTNAFEADENWFANYTEADLHSFYHAYNPYMEQDGVGGVYPEEYIRAVKKLYNITVRLESFERLPKKDGKVYSGCGHGWCWLYYNFTGYEETDSEIKILVDYYGDSMYFYPVIESEYTFSKNDDGTITLQKVEKIFDTGYLPAGGSV